MLVVIRWWGGPLGWLLPVLPVDQLFLVGFARVANEPGVLSQRCTTPAFGQSGYAVLMVCLIPKPQQVGLWLAHFTCTQMGVCWSQYGTVKFCVRLVAPQQYRLIRHATHPMLSFGPSRQLEFFHPMPSLLCAGLLAAHHPRELVPTKCWVLSVCGLLLQLQGCYR